MLKAKIIQFSNQSPDKFLSLINDMDQEYRIFLKKASNKKVLTNVNGVWKHGSLNIGLSDDQAIVWLKDNADLYAMLRHQIRTGKVTQVEEKVAEVVEVASDSAPQTMSRSTISQLEKEVNTPKESVQIQAKPVEPQKKSWFTKNKNR